MINDTSGLPPEDGDRLAEAFDKLLQHEQEYLATLREMESFMFPLAEAVQTGTYQGELGVQYDDIKRLFGPFIQIYKAHIDAERMLARLLGWCSAHR